MRAKHVVTKDRMGMLEISYQSIKFSASLYFITYQLLSVKITGLTPRVISQVTEIFVIF